MSPVTRRNFLKTGVAASTAFATFTISGTKSSGNVLGANDRIRHGVVGIRGRGNGHLQDFAKMDGVDVTYLIDVDSRLFEPRSKAVKERGGNTPKCVQDVREALEDKNLDSISIATCNHTHALIAIWACQAGKDVYVEKPLSHNVYEGRKLAEAAKKYNRVVQHGTQNRSSSARADDIAAVHSGKYGKLLVSKGYCCKPRWSIGHKSVETPPKELDFNLWLGPAAEQPYHANLVPYNWHWFWDFGNGDTGNQGVHEMDIARWAIKGATMPNRVWSVGGRFGYDDQGETPNTQITVYEYGDVTLLFETRGLVNKHEGFPQIVTNEFYTTEGMIHRGMFYPKNGDKPQRVEGDGSVKVAPGGALGSFINAVRSRKPEDNNCDAEVGHYSSALCHLGNISYRLGKPAPFNGSTQTLGDDPRILESLNIMRENVKAVGVPLDNTTYQLGPVLEFDPNAERFIDNEAANALLTRKYREPFVVPEQV
jgi:predicted dehydrogenase